MKTYEVTIEETRIHRVTYHVQAENAEEAGYHDKCYQDGEKVDEEFIETSDSHVIKVEEAE